MKNILLVILLVTVSFRELNSQNKFDDLFTALGSTTKDTLTPSYPANVGKFKMVAGEYLPLNLERKVIKNPIGIGYPISFSVIYKNRLIALFDPGSFVCYKLPDLIRDTIFEETINRMKFLHHWIINDKLMAYSGDDLYFLNTDDKWSKSQDVIPKNMKAKLYDDTKYLVFSDCHGEFGGTIYFLNKYTGKIHFTEATCANTVYSNNAAGYFVLSSLGRMDGSVEFKEIGNPDLLPIVDIKKINSEREDGSAIGYLDSSRISKVLFEHYSILMNSVFKLGEREVFLTYFYGRTFLTEHKGKVIKIINPLFNNKFWMHYPITTNYGDKVLINYAHYMIAQEKEVAFILIQENKLIKVNWNKPID